jgi:transposase
VLVRRLEVLTGVGGRRRWSADDKARIVEETLAPGATVSEVARRHDIRPQQLFGWRRGMRTQEPAQPMTFVPALIEPPPMLSAPPRPKRSRQRGRRPGDGGIELEIDGVVMRVARGADAKTVAAVIRALKAEP